LSSSQIYYCSAGKGIIVAPVVTTNITEF